MSRLEEILKLPVWRYAFLICAFVVLAAACWVCREVPLSPEHWAALYAWFKAYPPDTAFSTLAGLDCSGATLRPNQLSFFVPLAAYLLFGVRFFLHHAVSVSLHIAYVCAVLTLADSLHGDSGPDRKPVLLRHPLAGALLLVFAPFVGTWSQTFLQYVQAASALSCLGLAFYIKGRAGSGSRTAAGAGLLLAISAAMLYEPFVAVVFWMLVFDIADSRLLGRDRALNIAAAILFLAIPDLRLGTPLIPLSPVVPSPDVSAVLTRFHDGSRTLGPVYGFLLVAWRSILDGLWPFGSVSGAGCGVRTLYSAPLLLGAALAALPFARRLQAGMKRPHAGPHDLILLGLIVTSVFYRAHAALPTPGLRLAASSPLAYVTFGFLFAAALSIARGRSLGKYSRHLSGGLAALFLLHAWALVRHARSSASLGASAAGLVTRLAARGAGPMDVVVEVVRSASDPGLEMSGCPKDWVRRVDSDAAARYFNEGLQADASGRLDEAIERTRLATQADPGMVVAHNNLGWFLQKKGLWKDALLSYEAALRLDPSNGLAANNRQAALLGLSEACRSPDRAKAAMYLARGVSAGQGGRLDDAVRETREALACDPRSASARNNLGWFLQHKGLLAEAAEQYEAALRVEPGNLLAKNNLAAVLRASAPCASPDPAKGLERLNRGLLLEKSGLHEEAIRETREALVCDPGSAMAHNNLGWYLQKEGLFEEAVPHYSAAVRLDPQNPLYRSNLRSTAIRIWKDAGLPPR